MRGGLVRLAMNFYPFMLIRIESKADRLIVILFAEQNKKIIINTICDSAFQRQENAPINDTALITFVAA